MLDLPIEAPPLSKTKLGHSSPVHSAGATLELAGARSVGSQLLMMASGDRRGVVVVTLQPDSRRRGCNNADVQNDFLSISSFVRTKPTVTLPPQVTWSALA